MPVLDRVGQTISTGDLIISGKSERGSAIEVYRVTDTNDLYASVTCVRINLKNKKTNRRMGRDCFKIDPELETFITLSGYM